MITVVLHNGLCNRLLPLISSIRLAKIFNTKVFIEWTYTPVRSCIAYHGDLCAINELFNIPSYISNIPSQSNERIYEFRYWENKDHIIDVSDNKNVFVNYALYTIISTDDNQNSFLKNLKSVIVNPQEIILDDIAKDLGFILKNDLTPISSLQDEIDKVKNSFFKNMIGIHIRKSDGGFASYDWKNIIKLLLKQSKNWCKNEDNAIFLATDDMDVYIEFASSLGSKLIFYNPPDNLNNSVSTSGNKFSNDKFNVMCAVVELYLLGSCNKMIIGTADSTFSLCAMLMTDDNVKKFLINSVDNVPSF